MATRRPWREVNGGRWAVTHSWFVRVRDSKSHLRMKNSCATGSFSDERDYWTKRVRGNFFEPTEKDVLGERLALNLQPGVRG